MKTVLSTAILSLCASSSAYADLAGLRLTDIFLPHHDASTPVAIWYPSISEGEPSLYAHNPVFEGVAAHMNAPLAKGAHPLVLLSHGMGGTDRAQAWLGAALAERGAITIAVNHPNSTWGDFDMSEGVKHWTRPQDLSAALDEILEASDFTDHIDLSRVMAAGFSYGGWTALSLGGARANHAGFQEACTRFAEMEACGLLLSDEVKMQEIDPSIWNADYSDARVTHVVAIEPGFVWGLAPSHLENLAPSTVLIGLGGEEDRMLATDFDRSGLAAHLGDRRIERFAPAYHFSAMPICTPAGEAILAAENDDPVCTDPDGSDRAEIHAKIIAVMAEELGL